MNFLGDRVEEAELRLIREVVESCGGLSRLELAATVCELLGWRRRSGSLKAREGREFLEKLERQGRLRLPEKRAGRPVGRVTEVPMTEQGERRGPLVGAAGDIGQLELKRVQTEADRRLFRELMGRYHYLGHAVPFGAHLRYLIWGRQPAETVLGCVQFSSAAWRLAVRDQWIGWNEAARTRGLVHVVSNSRYLLLPWVQVKNLASRVLSLAVRRLAADWPRVYGVQAWLAETLVDSRRYRGTCYRAANWIELGQTRGGPRTDRLKQLRGSPAPKTVLVYPLVRDAARRLREGWE